MAGCRAGQTCYPPPGTLSQFSSKDWVTTFVNPNLLYEFPLKPFHGSCGNTQTCRRREIGSHVAQCARRASNIAWKKVRALPSRSPETCPRSLRAPSPHSSNSTHIHNTLRTRKDSLQCSPLMTSLLGLFVTPLPYHKSKKSPERKKERSVAVSQACGSTAQVYSVQNTEKNKINSPKRS